MYDESCAKAVATSLLAGEHTMVPNISDHSGKQENRWCILRSTTTPPYMLLLLQKMVILHAISVVNKKSIGNLKLCCNRLCWQKRRIQLTFPPPSLAHTCSMNGRLYLYPNDTSNANINYHWQHAHLPCYHSPFSFGCLDGNIVAGFLFFF